VISLDRARPKVALAIQIVDTSPAYVPEDTSRLTRTHENSVAALADVHASTDLTTACSRPHRYPEFVPALRLYLSPV